MVGKYVNKLLVSILINMYIIWISETYFVEDLIKPRLYKNT